MAVSEHALNGAPFQVGDQVKVDCTVTSIASGATSRFGGSGDAVTLLVNVNGNAGEIAGVSFTVSPVQITGVRAQSPSVTYGPQTGPSGH